MKILGPQASSMQANPSDASTEVSRVGAMLRRHLSFARVCSVIPERIWHEPWAPPPVIPKYRIREFKDEVHDTANAQERHPPKLIVCGINVQALVDAFDEIIEEAVANSDFSRVLSPCRLFEVYVDALARCFIGADKYLKGG